MSGRGCCRCGSCFARQDHPADFARQQSTVPVTGLANRQYAPAGMARNEENGDRRADICVRPISGRRCPADHLDQLGNDRHGIFVVGGQFDRREVGIRGF